MRKLNEWCGSAGGPPICDSGARCGLWPRRESLPQFPYLFFWLAWPSPVLQTVLPCTCLDWCGLLQGNCSSEWCGVLLGNRHHVQLESGAQKQEGTEAGKDCERGRGMSLSEPNLGSGSVSSWQAGHLPVILTAEAGT